MCSSPEWATWLTQAYANNNNFPSGAPTFSSALGSRSQTREAVVGMLTVERADYMQEMDCHYFDSCSVDRWSVCRSCLVLMCQLNIVIFLIFATFAVPFRLVLSVEHEPEITGPTAPATASMRHWQPECFLFRKYKTMCFLCFQTIAPLLIVENVVPLFNLLIEYQIVASQLF